MIRIFFDDKIINNIKIIDEKICHYLLHVMRIKIDQNIIIYNSSGEFIANIIDINKKYINLEIKNKTNKIYNKNNIKIAIISIIKKDPMSNTIRHLCELGCDYIIPLIAERSQEKIINVERLQKISNEASEQCESLQPTIITKQVKLKDIIYENKISIEKSLFQNHSIKSFNDNRINNNKIDFLLLCGKERYDIENKKIDTDCKNTAIMIGPEGGFSQDEQNIISKLKNSYYINLSENILKSDTAAIVLYSNQSYMLL